ncbi:hypothetical protein D910_02668 [Dendroctonus ponderosae]
MGNEMDEMEAFEEDQDENQEVQNGGEEMVHVPLDIQVGDQFSSFAEFKEKLDDTSRENLVRFSKRDSRTLEAAKRKVKRPMNPELEFYHLRYACFYSQKNRPRGTGKRNRRSLARQFDVSCPASISLKATENGQFLEVYNIMNGHNHPVNEDVFSRLMPKRRNRLHPLSDYTDKMTEDGELDSENKYDIILKKCRHIARLGSISSMDTLHEILKNLDDYIYYLKYTSKAKEMEQLEADEQENQQTNSDDAMQETLDDESIRIIVEADDVMD